MSSPPPLRRSRRLLPPPLDDDAASEIFMRLPPDDPASLVRAAAVCKNWRRILSSATFARAYRKFHAAPPVLGFLYNSRHVKYCISHFVPTASSFCPPRCGDRRDWYVLDSRHGRILFWTPGKAEADFAVCDPMTGAQWRINPRHSAILPTGDTEEEFGITWNAAVLCSKKRCDHLDCSRGPFLVVLVVSDEVKRITFATVYSSANGEWSETIFIDKPNAIREAGHSVLLEDAIYFPCETTTRTVEYKLVEKKLSVINTPFQCQKYRSVVNSCFQGRGEQLVLMAADDGMLLFVGMWEFKLHLCSIEPGAVAWERCRVIELKPLLRTRNLSKVSVVGVMEGAGVIFLNTGAGLFKVDLKSGRSKKLYEKTSFEKIVPYRSFYTGVYKRALSRRRSR